MKRAAIIGMLLAADLCRAAAGSTNVSLTISAHWGANGGYTTGRPVLVRCVIENRGAEVREIGLKEQDEYHGTLPYPTSLTITVRDMQGNPFVERWTQYVLWSEGFDQLPGDRVALGPGEKVVRIVSIDQILIGAPFQLDAGSYRIQLRLDDVISNELTIEMREPDPSGKPTPAVAPD